MQDLTYSIIQCFMEAYDERMPWDHPRVLGEKQWHKIVGILEAQQSDWDTELEDWQVIIERYFDTHFEDCDYRLNHFASEAILQNRFYEELY